VQEQTLQNHARPDGTLYDAFRIPRGYWEAKDTNDDLDAEIRAKINRGYSLLNTIFEDTRRAVLYQNGRIAYDADTTKRAELAALLERFFGHTEAQIEEFHDAVRQFQDQIPELARGLEALSEQERGKNQRFVAAFAEFERVCRNAINPNISVQAIEEMLVQHLLTERLFRTVFGNENFTRRNVIAAEIEKVIDALTSRAFSRRDYLRQLDHFYNAIEDAARTIDDWGEKKGFLNTVYERFFQGFSRKQADTFGIVYTPQPIVDFMLASVEEVLQREFNTSLSTPGVRILDPATGTGNFIVNMLKNYINRSALKRKYAEDLFANEVMLLPYYIASLNIEHAYYELTGEYAPFEGICFVDTLDIAEAQQLSLFSEENTERVEREKNAEITVIIGNLPYNVGQLNENDNNKNRKYDEIDKHVRETYARDSRATNKNALSDVYVKFFRWAADRLRGQAGISLSLWLKFLPAVYHYFYMTTRKTTQLTSCRVRPAPESLDADGCGDDGTRRA
jgi:predicted helicase